ncbi:hypothetical protein V2I01_14415 [Micromonospora sp. BRA006-A]|nr:hypothetical protein [Micromonospora sp. BRA006-A]
MTTHGDSATRAGAPAVAARTGPTTGDDQPAHAADGLPAALTGLRAAIGAARARPSLGRAGPARRHQPHRPARRLPAAPARPARRPLLVVVGGSTGAGKSTLVNSLVQARVSAAGVLRPTTRSPVLVCSPTDAAWFRQGELLPGLTRTTEPSEQPGTLHLVTAPALPPGLAFLDAPDIDSVVDANRALAGQLLAAADLWLFVTTAARYADAVLGTAAQRPRPGHSSGDGAGPGPPEAADEVAAHLSEMLAEQELGASPLFVLPETWVDGQGLLPDRITAPLSDWFARLAADSRPAPRWSGRRSTARWPRCTRWWRRWPRPPTSR